MSANKALCHMYPLSAMHIVSDTVITEVGRQEPNAQHTQGPIAKTAHILQYIYAGTGVLRLQGKTYELGPGDLFYLPKNLVLSYHAHPQDPYTYHWVGFDGASAANLIQKIGLTPDNPVLHLNDKRITDAFIILLQQIGQNNLTSYTAGISSFFALLSLLLSFNEENMQKLQDAGTEYVNKALWFIRNRFADDINVTTIADAVGLGRNHFSTLFHKHTGMPPIEYLMRYRISQAKKMLKQGMSVTDTSISCGFNSPANFSVQFKKITGIRPVQYNKRSDDFCCT